MSPEMREQMDQNEMWQLMESGELHEMMQDNAKLMGEMPGVHGSGGQHGGG